MLRTTTFRTLVVLVLTMTVCGRAQTQEVPAQRVLSSRLDLSGAYSWWLPHGNVQGFPYNNDALGMLFSGTYLLSPSIGIQVEAERHQQTATEGMRAFSAGFSARRDAGTALRVSAHVLFGACNLTGPNVSSTAGSSFYENPPHWGVAFTWGGSLDLATPLYHHRIGFRIVQADDQFDRVNFGPARLTTGGLANLNAVRLSTGIVIHIWK